MQNPFREQDRLEKTTTTKIGFNTKATRCFPHVVLVAEESDLTRKLFSNGSDGSLLFSDTRNSDSIRLTCRGPSGLKNISLLSTTDIGGKLELTLHKFTSLVGSDATIEEALSVDTDNIHNTAKSVTISLDDVESLSGW